MIKVCVIVFWSYLFEMYVEMMRLFLDRFIIIRKVYIVNDEYSFDRECFWCRFVDGLVGDNVDKFVFNFLV